jgi:DNA-binding CsgD family transcriptional regulator
MADSADVENKIIDAIYRGACDYEELKRAAAKVVEAVLEGIPLKDYADREGISVSTVKFHLKTAFDRTGSRSQADLVRRALLALNDLGPYFLGKD